MAATTQRWWCPGAIPSSTAISVNLGPAWVANAMTTTSTPAMTSLRGYSVTRRHKVSGRFSSALALG